MPHFSAARLAVGESWSKQRLTRASGPTRYDFSSGSITLCRAVLCGMCRSSKCCSYSSTGMSSPLVETTRPSFIGNSVGCLSETHS